MTTPYLMQADDKVLIGLTHAEDEPENVLIAYLMGVEALASESLNRWVLNTNVDTMIVRIDRGNPRPQ